ncbi:MAG: HAMP domain-containing histidine kinase [Oscillospiraceae bacterium]|nr:HAMP domain-containing histidine kinase [Oscillospiraceae bacterium]
MVTDAAGFVLYDTALTDNAAGRYVLYREIYAALNEMDGFWSKFSQGVFQSKAAVPVMSRGRVIGAVYLCEYDTVQGPLLLSFQSVVANLSVGAATAVLLISLIVSSVLTRRMAGLLRAIRLAREGEYSHPAPVRGKDELAELAKEFNELTVRIQHTDELRRQFVSDASHELKTPLASMRLLADSILLTEDMPLSEVREFVGDIGDEIDRLSRMTEKLMLLTRLDARVSVELWRVELAPLIMRARNMLEPLARQADVAIQCELDDGCAITANRDDIYQIVFNLMENAIKYNHPHGRVSVYMYRQESNVVIHVDDTGAGIPESDLPRLFERFYRVDKARARLAGGAGLGLSIVRDIVERYDGSITIKSEIDKGSRFTVMFPRADLKHSDYTLMAP